MNRSDRDRQWLLEHSAQVVSMALSNLDIDVPSFEQQQQNSKAVLKDFSNDNENNVEENAAKLSSEKQLEQRLGNLLKYGVLLASAVVITGGILYLIHHGGEPAQYQVFRGEPTEFRSPIGVIRAVLSGSRRAIVQLGLLLLIATPIVRVVVSLFTFIKIRNFIYAIITFLVLSGLIYSLIGAYY
jgi:uncharacterized membrane protein